MLCPFCSQLTAEHQTVFKNEIIIDAYWICVPCKKAWGLEASYWYQDQSQRHKFLIPRKYVEAKK